MATFISHNPAETAALGEQWGRDAQAGWVLGLSGGLGAGKTILAAGLARGLGVTARVQSPTFALVNEYRDGRLPLFHLDLYRLASRDDIIAAGLEPYLVRPSGVAVVEWIERWLEDGIWQALRGVRFRRVEIKTTGETVREIVHEDFGG
jgi:tRNA threonylcarbamoyladenosine biosynthesis protein TsaE